MNQNKIFLFPIQTKDLSFRFRLLKVSLSSSVDKSLYDVILNKAKKELAGRIWKYNKREKQNKWSVLMKMDAESYVAVPEGLGTSWPETPFTKMNRTVSFLDTGKSYSFNFDDPMPYSHDLALG